MSYCLMIFISIFIRFYLYSFIGPIWWGDSTEYLEVINNIYNGRQFSSFDIIEGKLVPYSSKMPVFFYLSALSGYIFGHDFSNNIILINLISSIITIFLTVKLAFYLTKDKKLSNLSGWLMVFNPNLIFNSMMIMSDTVYSLVIVIFVFIFSRALIEKRKTFILISGLLLGITVLTRPILKFYWIIITLFLLLNKYLTKKENFCNSYTNGIFCLNNTISYKKLSTIKSNITIRIRSRICCNMACNAYFERKADFSKRLQKPTNYRLSEKF